MTLLRDIQEAASNPDVRVADLLRKCKILAFRLKSEDLKQWVDHELDGYDQDTPVPTYRFVSRLQARGQFVGPFGSGRDNAPIGVMLLPELYHKWAENFSIRQGVMQCEDMLASEETQFRLNWPSDLLQFFPINVYEGMHCLQAWSVIPRSLIVRVTDGVRNKTLEFVLEIEKQNPEAGEAEPNTVPVPPAVLNTVFNNTFHGSVGNFAAGSQGFSQQATVQQLWAQASSAYDLPTLARELAQVRQAIGAQPDADDHLQDLATVTSAEVAAKNNDGPKMIEHLKDFGKWGLGVATTVEAGTLLALVKQHLGLH